MPGTIVIVNGLMDLPRPHDRGDNASGPVSTTPHVTIDGPGGYHRKGVRAEEFEVEPGTYRMHVSWAFFRSNVAEVEVREGVRQHVDLDPTPYYNLTRIPLLGALPGLVESIIPGTAIRLSVPQP